MSATAAVPTAEQQETGRRAQTAHRADTYGLRSGGRAEPTSSYWVRAFPNEDVAFWRKQDIDNTRVVPQDDPKVGETCWKMFSVTALVVIVVVGLLLPNAYGLLTAFRIQQLSLQTAALKEKHRRLKLDEERLTSPARLEEVAAGLGFNEASPRDVIHLHGRSGEAVAMRGRPRR